MLHTVDHLEDSSGLFRSGLIGYFTTSRVMVKIHLRNIFYLKSRISQKVNKNIKMSFLNLDKVNFFLENL